MTKVDTKMRQDNLVLIELDDEELFVLDRGLVEWGGPARLNENMAVAMGWKSVDDFFSSRPRFRKLLESRQPMQHSDWERILLATEIVFASDVVGSGVDWSTTTGLDDQETISSLRRIQLKILKAIVRDHTSN
jgi:hypothetical protein